MKTAGDAKYSNFTNYQNFAQQRQDAMEIGKIDSVENPLNEERIVSTYHKDNKKFYYDNSSISMSYGQYNIEKCLFVLLFLITYSTCLGYYYYESFDYLTFVFLIIGGSIDVLISFMYLILLIKLRSDTIFNKIPTKLMSFTDLIILANFIVKISQFILVTLIFNQFDVLGIVLIIVKLLFEIYFTVISVKLFMFCPCSVYVQEQTQKLWNGIKYYIFCCEIQDMNNQENPEYTKLDDLDSF
jgi:hypothetical protein